MNLSNRALDITESLTLSINATANKMKSQGMDVIGFGAGEPDFNTPDFVINAAKEALDKGLTKYTSSSGTIGLKEAVCRKFERDNNLNYKTDEIIISNGAKHSLYNAFQAIINPGDEVIIPSPYWLSYPEMVKLAAGIPVFVNTSEENNFKIESQALRGAVTNKTKAIILNNPCNPCGSVYNEDELRTIGQIALENNLYIICDEIYEKFVYDGHQHISIASISEDIKDITVTINGLSKSYAMTGWRIGYAAGNKKLIKAMGNIQSHSTSNPNSIAQYASCVALNTESGFIDNMRDEFDKRRQYMVEKINSIENLSCTKPSGAFYIMMNISKTFGKKHNNETIKDSITFAKLLLDSKMVTVVSGKAFGADNFVRLSYAVSMDDIIEGLDRIEKFTRELS